jgi:hypothetical protein
MTSDTDSDTFCVTERGERRTPAPHLFRTLYSVGLTFVAVSEEVCHKEKLPSED